MRTEMLELKFTCSTFHQPIVKRLAKFRRWNSKGKIKQTREGKKSTFALQPLTSRLTYRYCLIFSHPKYHKSWPVNAAAEKAKKWPERVEYRKTGIFQLVHFDMIVQSAFVGSDTLQTAYGPCWVFYETKVSGTWRRTSPADQWHFFKTKLGLK
jgi:hypothetical protein